MDTIINYYYTITYYCYCFAGNRSVTSHTVEVSTLGIVSDTKVFTSATKLPDVPASLWHSVACQALSSSFGIYCTRNSSDDPSTN